MPTGTVPQSHFAVAAPLLFVCNEEVSLRLCIDYRSLSYFTILKKYFLPLISELLDKTMHGKWVTRLDLKNRYNIIKIAGGDVWKRPSMPGRDFSSTQ